MADPTAPLPPKGPAATALHLRVPAQRAARYNRKTVLAGTGLLLAVIAGTAVYGVVRGQHDARVARETGEQRVVYRPNQDGAVAGHATGYDTLTAPAAPVFPEARRYAVRVPDTAPLPPTPVTVAAVAPAAPPPAPASDEDAERRRRLAEEEERAHRGELFFFNDYADVAGQTGFGSPPAQLASAGTTGVTPDAAGMAAPAGVLPQLAQGSPLAPGQAPPPTSFDGPSLDFIEANRSGAVEDVYLQQPLLEPISPYEIKAGTIIPAAMITGLNSDTPGEVIAQTTQDVYDTRTGRFLLIPRGTRLFGVYDSRVRFAQSRATVLWNRLIFANGNSIQLQGMIGADRQGAAGLEDQVDFHTGRLIGGVLLSTLISIGASAAEEASATDTIFGRVGSDAAGGAAQEAVRVGSEINRRNLDVAPTIRVRPGFPLNVLVGRDLVLQPHPQG